jgi:hypothetical protein
MCIALDDGKDEAFDFYYRLIKKRSKKIGMDGSILKQAVKVYEEVVGWRRGE